MKLTQQQLEDQAQEMYGCSWLELYTDDAQNVEASLRQKLFNQVKEQYYVVLPNDIDRARCAELLSLATEDREFEECGPLDDTLYMYEWEIKYRDNMWHFTHLKKHGCDFKRPKLLDGLLKCRAAQKDATFLAGIFADRLNMTFEQRQELLKVVMAAYKEGGIDKEQDIHSTNQILVNKNV